MPTETLQVRVDEKGAATVRRRIDSIGKSAQGAEGSVSLLRRALGLLGGALAAREFLRFTDTAANLENRLRVVTDTSEELARVQEELFAISQRTRTGFEATVELYSRLALSSKDLGVSSRELLAFTESLNQAVTISGANAQEASAAMIQLAQGMAAGALRGEEFRSVIEQTPVVIDVLAKELGKTRGEMRAMAEEGLLTTELILEAFANASDELEEGFGKTVPTLGQRMTQLSNATIKLVGDIDEAIGVTAILGGALALIAENMDIVKVAILAAGAILLKTFGPAAITALVSRIAILRAAMLSLAIAGPIGAAQAAFGALFATIAAHPFVAATVAVTGLAIAITKLVPTVGELTTGIDEMAEAAVAKASPAFRALSEDVGGAREQLRKLATAGDLGDFALNGEEAASQMRQLELRSMAATMSIEEFQAASLRAFVALGKVDQAITRVDLILKESAKNYEEAARSIAKIEKAMGVTNRAFDEHKLRVEQQRREYQQLVEDVESFRASLDPVLEAQFALRDVEKLLNDARLAGIISRKEEIALIQKKREEILKTLTAQQRVELGGADAGGFETFATPGGGTLGGSLRSGGPRGLLDDAIALAEQERAENATEAQRLAAEATAKHAAALQEFRQGMDAITGRQPGLSSALQTIRDDLTDVGTATERTLINAFRGAEDALVNFVQTGKFEFSSLVDSILADLTRLLLRQALLQLLGNPAGAAASAGGLGGLVGGLIGSIPGAAHGADFTVPGAGAPDSKLLAMRVSPGEHVAITPRNKQAQAPSQRPVINLEVRLSPDELRSTVLASEGGQRAVLNILGDNPSAARDILGGG